MGKKEVGYMNSQKKAVAINDISGVGRCSVTVACPILSAAGVETSILPTALLSTHTGGFAEYTFLDLTDEMEKIAAHWKSLGLKFDAIYSGYLGSSRQVDTVNSFIDDFSNTDTIVMVDPVMGDSGRFYAGISSDYVEGMKKLCMRADIIVPNITEALFLLGKEYTDGPYTPEFIKDILKSFAELGCKNTVLTGVHFNEKEVGAASYDSTTDDFEVALAPRVEGFYHGTGDVFASALLGGLLNNKTLAEAARIAVNFTEDSIIRTRNADTDTRYGVIFEKEIPSYVKKLGL